MSNTLPINDDASHVSPWHEGEIAIQSHAGVRDKMDFVGKMMVRNFMPDQHREFYESLPFIVAGLIDPDDEPWATFFFGTPGFIAAPSPTTLTFNAQLDDGDPAAAGFKHGFPIGLLGIELETRRRNRANGQIKIDDKPGFNVDIQQTMGNCPKYISVREHNVRQDTQPQHIQDMTELDQDAIETIQSSDTFFVASYLEEETDKRADASHRGGKPGFVRVNTDGSLTIPDFAGNLFFNTLGNILMNGKAGLTFPDFETGEVLQMTGTAEVILESGEIKDFAGAQRLWTFNPEKIVRRQNALPLAWRYIEDSPFNAKTGQW